MRHLRSFPALNFVIISALCFCFMGLVATGAHAGWEQKPSGSVQNLHAVSFVDPDTGYVVEEPFTILFTTDGGDHWSPQTTPVLVSFKDISFCDAQNGMVVGSDRTILHTTNGVDWTTVQTGLPGLFFGAKMLTPTMGAAAGVDDKFRPHVAVTTDGWQSFTTASFLLEMSPGQKYEGTLYDVDFASASVGFAAAGATTYQGAIVRTTDGGTKWETVLWAPMAFSAVDFVTEDIGYAVGKQGTIVKTVDGGDTWEKLDGGVTDNLYDVSFENKYVGTVAGRNGVILRTTDGGATWAMQQSGVFTDLNALSFVDPNMGYAVGDDGKILKTSDGGGCALIASPYTMSASSPGSVTFSLDAMAFNAGRDYLMLGSITGTEPGFFLPGGQTIMPLNWDLFTNLALGLLNTPVFTDFMGTLDASGTGAASFNTFSSLPPEAVGLVMNYAFALTQPWDYASTPVPIEIVP